MINGDSDPPWGNISNPKSAKEIILQSITVLNRSVSGQNFTSKMYLYFMFDAYALGITEMNRNV